MTDTVAGEHVATLKIYKREDGLYAFFQTGNATGEWSKLPKEMEAQLPMALGMINSQLEQFKQ